MIMKVKTSKNILTDAAKGQLIGHYQKIGGFATLIEKVSCGNSMIGVSGNAFKESYSFHVNSTSADKERCLAVTPAHTSVVHSEGLHPLNGILHTLTTPALFWLDGLQAKNASGATTALHPILLDLKAICSHHRSDHLILIDHASLFNGSNRYPSLEEIQKTVAAYHHPMVLIIENDIIRLMDEELCGKCEGIISDPVTLLTYKRFDVAAKLFYAEMQEKGVVSNWPKELYLQHLKVWNNFNENPQFTGQQKNLSSSFVNDFDTILKDIKADGFDADRSRIWVNERKELVNGAHRTAAAILYNSPIAYEMVPSFMGQEECSAGYFRNKTNFVSQGLKEEYLDEMARTYIRYKKDTRLVIVYPKASGKDHEIEEILLQQSDIVYSKGIRFNYHGLFNLVKVLYDGEAWAGSYQNGFEGIQAKTDPCFAENGTTRIYLIDVHEKADLVKAKERIRSLFGLGKHSVHINDHHEQTIEIAKYLFNNNSIDIFNQVDLRRTEKIFAAMNTVRDQHSILGLTNEECVINSSGSDLLLGPDGTGAVELLHGDHRYDDAVYDPRKYFYYNGNKFQKIELTAKGVANTAAAGTLNEVFTLCKNNAGLGILVVWPISQKMQLEQSIVDSLKTIAGVEKRVRLSLSKNGVTNLLRYIHYGKVWWEENLHGEVEKRCPAGTDQYDISVIIFRPKNINGIRVWKNQLRDSLGLNKSSFHITDPDCQAHIGKKCSCSITEQDLYVETLKHAQLLFNENSVHFLNYSSAAHLPKFEQYFGQYLEWIHTQNIPVDRLCIDNGGTLAAYGIRDVHDLDFLCLGPALRTGIPNVDCHNSHFAEITRQPELGITYDEVINDPKNHFYFLGVKVASFEVTKRIKQYRTIRGGRRWKDSKDHYLMNAHVNRIKNKGKKLILTTDGGLGNRLRTVAIYKTIAAFLGRNFYLYWPPNAREYNTGFNDLFQSNMTISKSDFDRATADKGSRTVTIEYGVSPNAQFGGRGGSDPLYRKDAHKVNELIHYTDETLIVNTLVKFTPDFIEHDLFDKLMSDTLSQLVPTEEILSYARMFEEKYFRQPIIGLHIRRTDREECSINSPDTIFIDLIQRYLQHDPTMHFYLATDSKETEQKLKHLFGRSIITIPKKYDMPNWQRPTSTKESLIEMLMLSRTGKVYGSYSSSFGSIAARMGKIPFRELTVSTPGMITRSEFEAMVRQTEQAISNADAEKVQFMFKMLSGYPETQIGEAVDLTRVSNDVQYAERMLGRYRSLLPGLTEGSDTGTTAPGKQTVAIPPAQPHRTVVPAAEVKRPEISVVIPCYNQAQYLPEAVESVAAQTFTDWELIIVNDGSTDRTSETANELIRRYPGRRIVLLEKKNGGLSDARNYGIERATGTYILPFDADDLLQPTMLESVLAEMKRSGCDVIYTDQEYFEADQKIVQTLDFDRNTLFLQNYFAYCSFYRKDMWKTVGGYKRSMKWGYEDWEFWISCAEAGYTFRRLPKVLFKYRVKKNSMLTTAKQHDQELKAQIILHHPNLYSSEAIASARRLIGMGISVDPVKAPQPEISVQKAASHPFTVTAIISSFNEGDVIYHVIGDLISNGVQVYLLDNCSTDHTVKEASRWLGKGLIHIERFPDDSGYSTRNKKEYVWRDILRRKQELAQTLESDWFIHADADEFRESPYMGQTLSEGIETVDKAGFSAINFELLNFRPVNNNFVPGTDVRKALTHFEKGDWFDSAQIKAWKNTGNKVDLVSTGGHSAAFEGRKVYPVPFILRHYPIRSEQHGMNKVYQERLARFAKEERDAGWHVQYDELVKSKRSFLFDERTLTRYDGEQFRLELTGRAKKRIALYRSPHSAEIMNLENTLVNVPYDIGTLRRLSSLYRLYGADEFAAVLLKRILEVQPNDAAVKQEIDSLSRAAITAVPLKDAPKSNDRTSIIIPVFNKAELTRACLQALYRTVSKEHVELIIVDNGSTDGTKDLLRELKGQHSNITVIENKSNLGFSKANNIGARAATGTHLLFLNNDTEPTSGWLENLFSVYREEKSVGIVGAKLLYPNRTIQHAGIEFLRLQQPVHFDGVGKCEVVPDHPYRNQSEQYPEANIRRSLDMVTGACLLIDSRLFAEVGGFNESYLNGCEDIDLCLKVRNKGLQVFYEPSAVVIHHEGQSEGRFTHVRKNLELFFKHWGKQFDRSWKFVPDRSSSAVDKSGMPVVVWEGSQYVKHSLALINREMCIRLAKEKIELSLIPYGNDTYTPSKKDPESILRPYFRKKVGVPDIHVRLQWPPNLEAPPAGHWVINQPWEFGILPKEWVNVFARQVDEMWVISSYVRDVYVNSGIPADRVFVIPCGINPGMFHPSVPPYRLKTKKQFKFLFVGGTILRKGIDILLDAYTQAFTASDDVCLVIKDMGGDSFYKGMNCRERIASIVKEKNAPAIEYIDTMLSDKEIASLYTACDVLVHPYRGEGFGLPILEAMACGTPAIVTNGGACLDFCSEKNSLLINAQKVFYTDKRIGEYEMDGLPWLLEPSLDHLKELMVYALHHPAEMDSLGARATQEAHQSWTWDQAYEKLKERISLLHSLPIKRFEPEKEASADRNSVQVPHEIIRSIDTVYRLIEEEKADAAVNELERIMTMAERTITSHHKQRILSDLTALRSLIEQSFQQAAPDPMLETAERLLGEEKATEAKILLAGMLTRDPENIHILNDLAVAAIMEKNYIEAAEYLKSVVTLDPSNETAIGNLEYLKGILAASLGESSIQAAESLIVEGETAKARIILQEVLLADPDHIDALNDLSVVEIMEKNWREAAVLINKVVTLDPSNESAKQNMQYLDQAVSGLETGSGSRS